MVNNLFGKTTGKLSGKQKASAPCRLYFIYFKVMSFAALCGPCSTFVYENNNDHDWACVTRVPSDSDYLLLCLHLTVF